MKKIITALITTFAFLATPATAADTPFYVGAQVGAATSILGGYQIDKMFSAEALYSKYDEYATSIGVFGVASFQNLIKANPKISLFAKAGIVKTSVDIPSVCQTIPFFGTVCAGGGSYSSTDLSIGGGAEYEFNKNVSARVGLDMNEYDDDLYVGVIYKF
jgi:hypothetical protein